MGPLEIWYDRIDLSKGIEDAPDKATRKRREQLDQQARKRVAENLFPKLVTTVDGRPRIGDQPPLIFHQPDLTEDVALQFLETYRASLAEDRRVLFDRYRYEDGAVKVVGVGSVGTRCFVTLFSSPGGHSLLLQVKEALPSVVQDRGLVRHRHHGQQVVDGQRRIQSVSDPFLGWTSVGSRPFFVRQLRDMKDSVDPKRLRGAVLRDYAETCGAILAKAHARTGYPSVIASYCGSNDNFDLQLAAFARAYADQVERDHDALARAVRAGTLPAEPGV